MLSPLRAGVGSGWTTTTPACPVLSVVSTVQPIVGRRPDSQPASQRRGPFSVLPLETSRHLADSCALHINLQATDVTDELAA